MDLNILFADNLHFHEKNFKSMFDFLKENNIKHVFNKEYKDLMSLYGDYISKEHLLTDKIQFVKILDKETLFNLKYNEINVFNCLKTEILSFIIPKEKMFNKKIENDDKKIFEMLFEENKYELLLNYSAALLWIDFWKKLIFANKFTHCCIFSGSLIYAKTLLEILKTHTTEPIVFESFYTGNDFYAENKYSHIANNTDMQFDNVWKKFRKNIFSHPDRIKAINKMLAIKNKNVSQPDKKNTPLFLNGNTILIIGQVPNDFSILETKLKNISTVSFYKELIEKILTYTSYNVIFKAHPWEQQKIHLRNSVSKEYLEDFFQNTLFEERLKIVEDYNLYDLFDQSEHVIVLNSQSGIEAAFHGLCPIQMGKAFYGNKGFTHDIEDIDVLVEKLNQNSLNKVLTLDQYDIFEEYMTYMMMYHLVCVFPSGKHMLKEIFKEKKYVTICYPKKTNIQKNEIVKEEQKVQNIDIDVSQEQQKDICNQCCEESVAIIENKIIKNQKIKNIHSKQDKKFRKLKKLFKNPQQFFTDSKKPFARFIIRYIFNK